MGDGDRGLHPRHWATCFWWVAMAGGGEVGGALLHQRPVRPFPMRSTLPPTLPLFEGGEPLAPAPSRAQILRAPPTPRGAAPLPPRPEANNGARRLLLEGEARPSPKAGVRRSTLWARAISPGGQLRRCRGGGGPQVSHKTAMLTSLSWPTAASTGVAGDDSPGDAFVIDLRWPRGCRHPRL